MREREIEISKIPRKEDPADLPKILSIGNVASRLEGPNIRMQEVWDISWPLSGQPFAGPHLDFLVRLPGSRRPL